MITFRTGSFIHKLITLLSTVGEFSPHSLYLLGNKREYKELVFKLTQAQTLRNPETEDRVSLVKVVNVSGKGKYKTVRLYKSAIPILKWIDAERYYLDTFRSHKFSGDTAHIERNHRVAEAVAMFMGAGFEFREYKLPILQNSEICRQKIVKPSFYTGRYLKQFGNTDINKIIFSRIVGAAIVGDNCYAVYNTRNAVMKLYGKGESKVRYELEEIMRYNTEIEEVKSAILFGTSDKVAISVLEEMERTDRHRLQLDAIYSNIHFVSLNEIGIRQLMLLTLPNWKERLLDLLFEPNERSFGLGSFDYDALIDGTYVLSYMDGDIVRLKRFISAVEVIKVKAVVLCFEDQVSFLQEYLKDLAQIRVLKREAVERRLNLKRACS